MKKYILFLLLAFSFTLSAQKYNELPEVYQDNISRSEWRKTVKAVEERDGDFGLSPIDMIYFDDKDVSKGRELGVLSVDSWGLDYLMPTSIRQRVVAECGKYSFVLGTVDSGTDTDHVELRGDHWLPSSNYTGQTAKHWHGTHVSGIMYQMVWDVIKTHGKGQFKDIQILNGQGSGNFSSAANMAASETAYFKPFIAQGTGVFLNNSWGYDGPPVQAFESEVEKSQEAGICWIGAAGNAGREIEGYPGMSDRFTSVASIDPNSKRSYYSTMNQWVDVAAPGSNINSTLPNDRQGKASGTSMASPFITGLAGLAYGKYGPILMGRNMNIYLNHICTDIPPQGLDKETGWGVPYVVKMLDTDPCSVPGISCDGGPNPPDPDPDPDPTPDPPVSFTSSVTFEVDGEVFRYRGLSQTKFRLMKIDDLQVTVTCKCTEEQAYDTGKQLISDYFDFTAMAIPEDPAFGYSTTAWWIGQFLEYQARQKKVDLQVQSLQGTDDKGRNAIAVKFDKASVTSLNKGYYFGPVRIDNVIAVGTHKTGLFSGQDVILQSIE